MLNYFKKLGFILLLASSFTKVAQATEDKLCRHVKETVREGDLVFLEITTPLFKRVSRVSGGWASHVGIVFRENNRWIISESAIPVVKKTDICKFIHHGGNDHFLIRRLLAPLTDENIAAMKQRSDELQGTFYHLGFKFFSNRQFCSKFVWELYNVALGINIGRFQRMKELLNNLLGKSYEKDDYTFWYFWYFGNIPFERITLTPVTEMEDPRFADIFYNPSNAL